jgi:hypothetical protein
MPLCHQCEQDWLWEREGYEQDWLWGREGYALG